MSACNLISGGLPTLIIKYNIHLISVPKADKTLLWLTDQMQINKQMKFIMQVYMKSLCHSSHRIANITLLIWCRRISGGFISDCEDSRGKVITLVREVVAEHNGKVTVRGVQLCYIWPQNWNFKWRMTKSAKEWTERHRYNLLLISYCDSRVWQSIFDGFVFGVIVLKLNSDYDMTLLCRLSSVDTLPTFPPTETGCHRIPHR